MGEIAKPVLHEDIVYSLVIDGDLSKLSEDQIVGYYYHRCELLGVDPGEKPFDLIRLSGKLVLYLTKSGAAALTRVNQLSVEIIDKGWDGEMYIVQARATTSSGRYADDLGVVDLGDERSLTRPNAMMKAATKAKRRAIIAVCGIGLLDESEVDGLRGAERVSITQLEQPEKDPLMSRIPARAARTMARCASIAAAKSTDDKLVTPRSVWEAACAKCKLPPLPDGSMPKIEQLRKSIAWPICDLIKVWAERTVGSDEPREREPGEDRDVDDEPLDVEYEEVDPTAENAP